MHPTGNYICLILAAGSSSRLGTSKQLLKINATSLLEHSIKSSLESVADTTLLVLGADFEEHRRAVEKLPVVIVHNKLWQNGIGGSIAEGMKKILSMHEDIDAVVIMVCDQPFISGQHLNKLLEKYQTSGMKIIASSYANTMGVPAVFDKKYFQELASLGGEDGAKKLFSRFANDVGVVDFPRGEVDIDTPEDVANVTKAPKR